MIDNGNSVYLTLLDVLRLFIWIRSWKVYYLIWTECPTLGAQSPEDTWPGGERCSLPVLQQGGSPT